MECNYEPYVQITGTTSFPRLCSSPFTRCRELESLFQRERCCDNLPRKPCGRSFHRNGARENGAGGRTGGCRGNRRQLITEPDDAVSRAFLERYSHLSPVAFCVPGPDGSKSLCLNRKEYNAIVERSRNENSACVAFLRAASRCNGDQDLDDDVCSARVPSAAECRCRHTWDRPSSPVKRPESSCRGGKPRRANAGAMKAELGRTKKDKKSCSGCPRGSCGKPMNCSSQAYEGTSRPKGRSSKPRDGRLPPIEHSYHDSKSTSGSCCSCCCAAVCHRRTSDCAATRTKRRPEPTTVDSASPGLTGHCSGTHIGGQTNWEDDMLPPVWCSDSGRTSLRPTNLGGPICGYNAYEVRPTDCAKTNKPGPRYCSLDRETFRLSAM